jgi:hypothetical protein
MGQHQAFVAADKCLDRDRFRRRKYTIKSCPPLRSHSRSQLLSSPWMVILGQGLKFLIGDYAANFQSNILARSTEADSLDP